MIGLDTVIIVAIICVTVEAFFSGSEIAIVSASRERIRQLAASGDRGARMVDSYLKRPQILLATTLLGTNLATATFSVVVTLFVLGEGRAGGELLTVAVATPVTLLFGEFIPKTVFQQNADRMVTKIVYPLRLVSLLMRPAVWVMSGFADFMTRVLRSDRERAFVTREELALLIEADKERDAEITEEEREMISNVLELSEAEVGHVMVPLSEVTVLPADTSAKEAMTEVADKRYTRMPIYEGRVDHVVGVLHVFDLLQGVASKTSQPVRDLARPATFVPETMPAADLLVELQGTGNQMVVVVDEYGGAVGIVTTEDLLEEIVGEIEDEHDEGPPPISQERAGVWRVMARTSVERVNRELPIELPESDGYETIAGLLLDRFKRIPSVNESLVIGGVVLRVLAVSERAIEEVQILRRHKR